MAIRPGFRRPMPAGDMSVEELYGQLLRENAEIRKDLKALAETVTVLSDVEKSRAGAASVWRWIAGTAVTIAIGIASAALGLAQTASTDHVILERVVEEQREHIAESAARAEALRSREDRLVAALGDASAATRETRASLDALLERVGRVERVLDTSRRR